MEKAAIYVSLAGLIFSGYLAGTKLFSGGCAFKEPCPYFFGVPVCYVGFILYTILTALSLLQRRSGENWNLIAGVSGVGVLYAGYFTFTEIAFGFASNYALFLPTCAWGLIFFTGLLFISLKSR
jgi:uncharacterized membrane protein